MTDANVAIVYYSATGTIHTLAQAIAEGAEKAGAQVRLRKVPELAPQAAIDSNPAWAQHVQDSADVTVVDLDDIDWADAIVFGTPTRFGNPASQLRSFIDTTGPLWREGKLADKVYSAFTSSGTLHGGQETTIVALSNTFYHWGGIIVPPGFTDPVLFQTGNPYGTSHVANGDAVSDLTTHAARHQGKRVAETASAIKAGRAAAS